MHQSEARARPCWRHYEQAQRLGSRALVLSRSAPPLFLSPMTFLVGSLIAPPALLASALPQPDCFAAPCFMRPACPSALCTLAGPSPICSLAGRAAGLALSSGAAPPLLPSVCCTTKPVGATTRAFSAAPSACKF